MTKIYINDVDVLTQYGVFLISEQGMFDPPAAKNSFATDWDDEHGIKLVNDEKLIESRKFKLKIGIKTTSEAAFRQGITDFYQEFIDAGLTQLRLDNYPRVWMVQPDGGKPFQRLTHWNSTLMVGQVTLNLIEPEPITKQYQITGTTTTVSVAGSGDWSYTIYWGDGDSDVVSVATGGVGHTYASSGKRLVIAGRIEKASSFTVTNGTELTW